MFPVICFLSYFVSANLFQLNQKGSMEKMISGSNSFYLAQNNTHVWAFSSETKYDFINSYSNKFLVASVDKDVMLLFSIDENKFYHVQYSCPKTVVSTSVSIEGNPIFLRTVGDYQVLATQFETSIYFYKIKYQTPSENIIFLTFEQSFSLSNAKTFKYINCDSSTYCIIYTETNGETSVFVIDNAMTTEINSIVTGNGYCTTQQTPPLKSRKDAMECVSKELLTVTGINPISFSTSFSEEPISSVITSTSSEPIFVAFQSNKSYTYEGKFQLFTNEMSTEEKVIAAVDKYALTYSGIRSYNNGYKLINFKAPDPYSNSCSVQPKEIVYSVPAHLYYPSKLSLTQLYPYDCIAEVFINTQNAESLNEESLAKYNFNLTHGDTIDIPLKLLYSTGLLKVAKVGESYENAIKVAFGLKTEEAPTDGMYLYFMLNWTSKIDGIDRQSINIVNERKKSINLKGSNIIYQINSQKYRIIINSQVEQPVNASVWGEMSFNEYSTLLNIDLIENKYLAQRIVAQYWSVLTNKYDLFIKVVCQESTVEEVSKNYPGTCSEPTYKYSLYSQNGKEEEIIPNCCGSSSCSERELKVVNCAIKANDVYSSTLYKLASQKKYDFINEYQCRTDFFNGITNATGYGVCVYGKLIYLLQCEQEGTTSQCAQLMFSNSESKAKVELKEVVSDTGEPVTVSSVTSDATTSNTVVSTPETLNASTLKYKIQNILNSQNEDKEQESVTPTSKKSKSKRRPNQSPPRIKFDKLRKFTTKKGETIILPSVDLGDSGNAYLVGDGITVDNQDYITDDFTVCVEVNDYCSEQLADDQKIEMIYVMEGVNENNDFVVLEPIETPEYLNDSSKKVCNIINQPGTVYPVITDLTPSKDSPVEITDLTGVIVGIVGGVFAIVFCVVLVILVIVVVKRVSQRRKLKILNEAFQEDSISDL